MTLARDPTVTWAREQFGGIRITHMTHMKHDDRFMLTYSRNKKVPVKINHLKLAAPTAPAEPTESPEVKAKNWSNQAMITISDFKSLEELNGWRTANEKWFNAIVKYEEISKSLNEEFNKKRSELTLTGEES